eukprot:NODE_1313_length_1178_cov_332.231523.p1 GENE.NODE_1313_length_1178_cov_332.231523~~NODE_1313_length_1178_cov_332.231523.p1  ORF type:complete len:354 (-),score=60.13 NODE_1313_length_1178_cov_332.231523:99-1160(-)
MGATRRSDSQQFAVKHVCSDDDEVRRLTLEEYSILSALFHPAVVKVTALYASAADVWICMELCTCSVGSCIRRRGAFEESAAAPFVRQLLSGLDYLHRRRVVHRDLKPDNLLFCEDSESVKIADFNSAKQLGKPGSGLMLTDRSTHDYAAPELRYGQWNERVDVWSFGLCCVFVLLGMLPRDLSSGRPTQREALQPHMSPEWLDFLLRCITVEMRDRPAPIALKLHPALRPLDRTLRATSCSPPMVVQGRDLGNGGAAAPGHERDHLCRFFTHHCCDNSTVQPTLAEREGRVRHQRRPTRAQQRSWRHHHAHDERLAGTERGSGGGGGAGGEEERVRSASVGASPRLRRVARA